MYTIETENDFRYNRAAHTHTKYKKVRHKRHEDLLIHMNENQFDIGYLVENTFRFDESFQTHLSLFR